MPAPARWSGPLPHGGALEQLAGWWQRQGDPLLVDLILAAQAVSPTLASATARIAEARAARTGAGAALLPAVDGAVSASRGPLLDNPGAPTATTLQAGLQAQWEIDLFGAGAAARDAAVARFAAAQLQWHDARVAVAAEVAASYLRHGSCMRQEAVLREDAASRAESARLIGLATEAGFQAPATAALARASAAEGAVRAVQQRAACGMERAALSALTAIPLDQLGERLAAAPAPAAPPPFAIAAIPAAVLAQRPDVRAAEQSLAAAASDAASADARRYPRLALSGQVAVGRVLAGGTSTDAQTWSLGPIALSVPLFDGGRRAADAEAARARYDEAVAQLQARARQAVREVEEALIQLDAIERRAPDVQTAARGYRESFAATEARQRGGLASLVELEDARRLQLAADITLVELERDRRAAWLALYRAAGGGWSEDGVAAPEGSRPPFAAADPAAPR